MQRNRDKLGLLEPSRDTQENSLPLEDRDTLLQAKDQTIAELKEQVAFLRRQLERKDDILLRMAEGSSGGPLPAPVSEAPDGPRVLMSGEGGDSDQARDARGGQEKPDRPVLPDGYRVVAISSDAWVLMAPRGLRVAVYRGELDLYRAALDARHHHRRGES